MSTTCSRREALRRISAVGAGICLTASSRGSAKAAPPSDRLDLAFVGAGGQAHFSLRGLADQNIVALCDVDDGRAAQAYRQYPKAKKFRDFRRMLKSMDRQIDAVVVATPDHIHAPASLMAMRLGKHVYCEKPLTWSIEEARLMAKVAREEKVATQMGTQGMAMDGARAGVEMVRSGVLGTVQELHVWTDRAKGWWPQGVNRPTDTPPVPKNLDWDLWLGPAPERPYHPAYVPFKWRGWQDFGTGAVGDMGIHNAAMAWMGLELGLPASVEVVETSGTNAETFPTWSMLKINFAATAANPAITLHWYDGGKKPSRDLIGGRDVAKNGAIVVGSKGTLYSIEWTGADWHLYPEAKFRNYAAAPKRFPRVKSHHHDWVQACKGGHPTLCNFPEFASPLTEIMLLGALAQRLGKDIQWNAKQMQAEDCPEAESFIRRPYSKGWELTR
jgi:predicted dehydrogenase